MVFKQSLKHFRCAIGVLLAVSGMSVGAQDFPTRPITLVSPYQAGGGADGIARAIAEAAGRDLGQTVVVDAKPGAEGLIGSNDVLKAPPDGYRLLWGGAGSLMVNTALRHNPPFDPVTAFTPVAAAVEFSFFLYVNPELPVKNMKEFIAYVKANPGKVTYATGNNQGLLTMADIQKKYGLDMTHARYKGEVGAASDLISNRVQAIWATTALLPQAREGKLRIIATSLSKRSPLLPDVPTLIESGTPAAAFGGGWLGIYGPANMPTPIVERLNKAFSKAFNDPAVQERMRGLGLVYTPYTTTQQLNDFSRSQRDLYIQTIKDLGIPKE